MIPADWYAEQWTAALDTADPTGDTSLVVVKRATRSRCRHGRSSCCARRPDRMAPPISPVVSTYRLQMRGDRFTFADAENLLDYLDELGISHLYLSPILTAAEGSTHGYDVIDPTDGVRRPRRRRRAGPAVRGPHGRVGSASIVDIVPNHVGVDDPRQNPWWWDVLTHGRESRVRDVLRHRLDAGPGWPNRLARPRFRRRRRRPDRRRRRAAPGRPGTWPIAPGTGSGSGSQVHDRQHYRLVGWRHNVCGYRRFFSITSLAGLRQEDRAVFDATHVEVKRWFTEGLVDGVRIDHPDGLSESGGLPRVAARTHRAGLVDRDREDPRGRRIVGADAARRRHHRLRRAARDRRPVRRSHRQAGPDRARRFRRRRLRQEPGSSPAHSRSRP